MASITNACEGFLLKLGDNKRLIRMGLKGFELRWATLDRNATLRYFRDRPAEMDTSAKPRGLIRLADSIKLCAGDARVAKGPFKAFAAWMFVVGVKGRDYVFLAQNKDDFDEWVAAVAAAVNPRKCRLGDDAVADIARTVQDFTVPAAAPAAVAGGRRFGGGGGGDDDDSDASDGEAAALVPPHVAAAEAAARAAAEAEVERLRRELVDAESEIRQLKRANADLRQTVEMRRVDVPVGLLLKPPSRNRDVARSASSRAPSERCRSSLEEPLLPSGAASVSSSSAGAGDDFEDSAARADGPVADEAARCRCVVS